MEKSNGPKHIFIPQPSHSSRLLRSNTLLCPFARTNYYFYSFVPSSIRAWNSLSEEQVIMQTLRSFNWAQHCNAMLCVSVYVVSIVLYSFWVHTWLVLNYLRIHCIPVYCKKYYRKYIMVNVFGKPRTFSIAFSMLIDLHASPSVCMDYACSYSSNLAMTWYSIGGRSRGHMPPPHTHTWSGGRTPPPFPEPNLSILYYWL